MTDNEDIDARDGGWWSRTRAIKGRTRNDHVAQMWERRGWGDDDYAPEDATAGLGQMPGPKYRGRSEYRRQRWEEADKKTRPVGQNTAERAITAHGMMQSFVLAFSDEVGYEVVYSLNSGAPAATIFERRKVLVDPAPLFDKTLSAVKCGLVMTALACHEVSHILFDRHHGEAVAEAIKMNRALALRVSNILSDRRIEQRFAAKYPGYSDVFDPLLEYVCRDFHGHQVTFDPADPANLAVAAVRYARWLDWSAPGMDAERIWWDDLADRAAQRDDHDWHVQHVIEGLKRLVKMRKNAPPPPPAPHPFKP